MVYVLPHTFLAHHRILLLTPIQLAPLRIPEDTQNSTNLNVTTNLASCAREILDDG